MTILTQTKTKKRYQPLEIKAVKRDEMPLVAGMIRSSADWYAEFVNEDDLTEHYVDKAWEERNFKRRDFFLGFNEKKEAVGTISLQNFNEYAYIGYLYLDTSEVGKGYGHTLMDFARSEALKRDLEGLCLLAHPEAVWAVKAYQKFGFECLHTEPAEILNWNDGALQGYYEDGFHLYHYPFSA
jgi:GNAT superfamily N-acetyltransferase